MFRITFKVAAAQPGDTISLNYKIRTVGDANAAGMSSTGSKATMKVAAPLSENNNLAALNVGEGSLLPAFSKNITQYTIAAVRAVEFTGMTDFAAPAADEPAPQTTVVETTPAATSAVSTESKKTDFSSETEAEADQQDGEGSILSFTVVIIVLLSVLLLAAAGFLIWIFVVKKIRI